MVALETTRAAGPSRSELETVGLFESEKKWLQTVRETTEESIATARHRLVAERLRLTVLTRTKNKANQTRQWREIVPGVNDAIVAATAVTKHLKSELLRVRARFQPCLSEATSPELHTELPCQFLSRLSTATLEPTLSGARRFWDACRRVDTDEGICWWQTHQDHAQAVSDRYAKLKAKWQRFLAEGEGGDTGTDGWCLEMSECEFEKYTMTLCPLGSPCTNSGSLHSRSLTTTTICSSSPGLDCGSTQPSRQRARPCRLRGLRVPGSADFPPASRCPRVILL